MVDSPLRLRVAGEIGKRRAVAGREARSLELERLARYRAGDAIGRQAVGALPIGESSESLRAKPPVRRREAELALERFDVLAVATFEEIPSADRLECGRVLEDGELGHVAGVPRRRGDGGDILARFD